MIKAVKDGDKTQRQVISKRVLSIIWINITSCVRVCAYPGNLAGNSLKPAKYFRLYGSQDFETSNDYVIITINSLSLFILTFQV